MSEQEHQRGSSVAIDLERLESHAQALFLNRFVAAVQKARGQYGRFLVLRSGDELAIKAAEDGSFELLGEARADLPQDADAVVSREPEETPPGL